jgi:uncharacterized protein YbjT (DUF2867 family)
MADARLVLVLGASGYVGGRLVPRLLRAGFRVRCLARTPSKLEGADWADQVEIVEGDLLEPATLPAAFEGVHAAFHLVHMMGAKADFERADREAAGNVARAAADAGVERIVYLGGLGEIDEATSPHLRSRAEVGEILLASPVPTTVLRAAVIIGSGSASFEMLRHLVEKLPVMVTPRWVDTRVQPIAIRDVLRYLVGVLDERDGANHVYDIGGPDVLTYLDMMQVYARVAGLPKRLIVKVPVLTPKLSSHWVNFVTPVPFGVAQPLVLSLSVEVVARPDGEDIRDVVPGEALSYEEALSLAIARVRDREVETSWRDAETAGRSPAEPYPGDPDWTGGTLYSDDRTATAHATAHDVFAAVSRIGGARGWPTHMWAWRLRGRLDQLVGGVGLRRGRRDPETLRVGDALDFWRVEDLREPDRTGDGSGLLRLHAEMRLPGRAWLEWRIHGATDTPGQVELVQRALFAPRGLFGRLYWWALTPFHGPIFKSMVVALARTAEETAGRDSRAAPPAAAPRGEDSAPAESAERQAS